MKTTAFLLNTSSGPRVVEHGLADALNSGALAGAGVAALRLEPPAAGSPLFTARNRTVTPHLARAAQEGAREAAGNCHEQRGGVCGGERGEMILALLWLSMPSAAAQGPDDAVRRAEAHLADAAGATVEVEGG